MGYDSHSYARRIKRRRTGARKAYGPWFRPQGDRNFYDGVQLYDEAWGPKPPRTHHRTREWDEDVYDGIVLKIAALQEAERNMGKGSKGRSPLKLSEFHRLLLKWEFQLVRTRGGHKIWKAPDGNVLVTASTGNMASLQEVRRAALFSSVGIEQFMRGPEKARGLTSHAKVVVVSAGAGTEEIRADETTKETEVTQSMQQTVLGVYKASPDRAVRNEEVRQVLLAKGMNAAAVSQIVYNLRHTGKITKVGNGIYRLAEPGTKPLGAKPSSGSRLSPGTWMRAAINYAESHPNQVFGSREVLESVDKGEGSRPSVNSALDELSKRQIGLTKLNRGLYIYKPASSLPSKPEPEPKVEDVQPKAVEAFIEQVKSKPVEYHERYVPAELSSPGPIPPPNGKPEVATGSDMPIFEVKAELGDSRYLVVDTDGQTWVARMQLLEI